MWMTLTNNCGLLEWRLFIGNKSHFVSFIRVCVVIVTSKSNSTYSWFDLIALHVRIVQARQLFTERRWISEHIAVYALPITSVMILCKPLEYVCIYKRYTDKSPHWFCPLSFSIWWHDSRRAGWKIQTHTHTRTRSRWYTFKHTHMRYVWTRASFACNFHAEGEIERVSELTGDGENSLATSASPIPSEKSLDQMYLACFPFVCIFLHLLCHLFGCL